MYPPIFSILSTDSDVGAIFGTNPVRVYPFGSAPENVIAPYVVWQIAGGAPENYIGNLPDIDSMLVQVDVYANSVSSASSGADALRDALEHHAHIVAWRGGSKDNSSGHYRFSFDINFLTAR